MRWQMGRRSSNVEDRRGAGGRGIALGGGGMLALAVVVMLMGGDPSQILMQALESQMQTQNVDPNDPEQKAQMDFVSSVLGSTEDVWGNMGEGYEYPTLVVYNGVTSTACGTGQSAMGPFYCPVDRKLYLDLSFFKELEAKLGAPGDFARAYVIAHEVGHHVQTLIGTADGVRNAQARASKKEANALSVKMELQADCYAGIWAHHAQAQYDLLEDGDIDEALGAASAVGDDLLQEMAGGTVMPDSFTHGSAAQRKQWFMNGYKGGTLADCDTFKD